MKNELFVLFEERRDKGLSSYSYIMKINNKIEIIDSENFAEDSLIYNFTKRIPYFLVKNYKYNRTFATSNDFAFRIGLNNMIGLVKKIKKTLKKGVPLLIKIKDDDMMNVNLETILNYRNSDLSSKILPFFDYDLIELENPEYFI